MTDQRVDALVRRLDVMEPPPPGFADETFTLIRAVAAEAGRADRTLLGRLRWSLPGGPHEVQASGAGWRLAVGLALLLLAVVLWGLVIVSGRSPIPAGWSATHVMFGRGHLGTDGYDLWIVSLDGTAERLLLPGSYESTRVSTDGSRFASPVDGTLVYPTLYESDATSPVELHLDPTLNLGVAAWSHDGEVLAFEAWDDADADRNGVYLAGADGSDLHRLTGTGVPGDFSPDDSQLLVTRQEGLFLVDVDGGGERQISPLKPIAYSSAGFIPGGRSIYAAAEGKLWVIDVATGSSSAIEVSGGNITSPRISPDGSRFVFVFDATSASTTAIWLMQSDGSEAHRLTDDPSVNEDFADWLP